MIINPMFFYLLQVSENVSMAMKIGGAFITMFCIVALFVGMDPFIDGKALFHWSKRIISIGIIIFFIGLLIPDRDTLLLMQAARIATTENVNSVFEALKAAMDYAVTILQ